jgi:hypothetical protein
MNGSMMKMKHNNATQQVATQFFCGLLVLCICSVGVNLHRTEKGTGNHERVVGAWTWTTQQSDGGLFTSVMDILLVDAGSLEGAIRNPKGESIPFESVTIKGIKFRSCSITKSWGKHLRLPIRVKCPIIDIDR